jgi:hypothetical protein
MFLKEAETQSFRTLTPKMGEKIVPGETSTERWWNQERRSRSASMNVKRR